MLVVKKKLESALLNQFNVLDGMLPRTSLKSSERERQRRHHHQCIACEVSSSILRRGQKSAAGARLCGRLPNGYLGLHPTLTSNKIVKRATGRGDNRATEQGRQSCLTLTVSVWLFVCLGGCSLPCLSTIYIFLSTDWLVAACQCSSLSLHPSFILSSRP